jgi:hypothetical protein
MRTAVGVLFGAALLAALIYASLDQASVSCEVCVGFGGGNECRNGSGATRDEAIRAAQTTACAVLASGVTQNIQCDRTLPSSVRCEE